MKLTPIAAFGGDDDAAVAVPLEGAEPMVKKAANEAAKLEELLDDAEEAATQAFTPASKIAALEQAVRLGGDAQSVVNNAALFAAFLDG